MPWFPDAAVDPAWGVVDGVAGVLIGDAFVVVVADALAALEPLDALEAEVLPPVCWGDDVPTEVLAPLVFGAGALPAVAEPEPIGTVIVRPLPEPTGTETVMED